MDRKEFLSKVGLGAASALFLNCLIGCSKTATVGSTSTPAPANVDFTIDLTASANSALTKAGGYLYINGIIVAKTTAGGYLAVSQSCPHQGTRVQYEGGPNDFYCPSHGAVFSSTGSVVSGPVSRALTRYTVTEANGMLHITG